VSNGGKAQYIRIDAATTSDAGKAVESAMEAFGNLNILVNNAGVYPVSQFLDITEEMWDRVINITLKSTFFYSQAFARHAISAGHGAKIINIASIDAMHPSGQVTHYNAAKGGVVMLTKAIALELAPYNILVNAVAPGGIMTPGIEAMMIQRLAALPGISRDDLLKAFETRVPLGRTGEPDDIAKVVLFLASNAANYMTGSLVVADGGYLQT